MSHMLCQFNNPYKNQNNSISRALTQLTKAFKISCALMVGFLFHSQAFAEWQLDNENSSFSYVSSKVSAVSEVNHFKQLSGLIDDNGNASLQIDLASVETAVEVRNQRVRDILFQVADFPAASVSLHVDSEQLAELASGESFNDEFSFSLSLHGIDADLTADLSVIKLTNNQLQIQLVSPLIIDAQDFNLASGVEELKEIAGLASINNNVIVDFSLRFVE